MAEKDCQQALSVVEGDLAADEELEGVLQRYVLVELAYPPEPGRVDGLLLLQVFEGAHRLDVVWPNVLLGLELVLLVFECFEELIDLLLAVYVGVALVQGLQIVGGLRELCSMIEVELVEERLMQVRIFFILSGHSLCLATGRWLSVGALFSLAAVALLRLHLRGRLLFNGIGSLLQVLHCYIMNKL